jgi:7,8-dihydropterin-6-yl-methyl-4-(beta-D-ribofuranosyl)aminobenzene 5'-phosphate synthase
VPRLYPKKNYPAGIEVANGEGWVADDVPDDQSLVFNTPRGLILLAGCGHAGIINTLEYGRKFIRSAPAHAVLGGFHLYDAKDEQLDWTADKLKEFGTAQILGGTAQVLTVSTACGNVLDSAGSRAPSAPSARSSI